MKVKGHELAEVVRALVREEVKKQIGDAVRECLTERYLRNLVSEVRSGPGPTDFSGHRGDSLDPGDDEPPVALPNTHMGIYDRGALKKEVSDLLDPQKNPFASMFEGVRPLPRGPVTPQQAQFGDEGVPLEALGLRVDRRLVEGRDSGPMQKTPEGRMREIEQRRQMLDVPVDEARRRGII